MKEGARPPKTHKYKTPIHLRDMLQKFHETLYRDGFIKPVEDVEHMSPTVLVKKPASPDGTSRGD